MRSALALSLLLCGCVTPPAPAPTPPPAAPVRPLAEAPKLRLPDWARPISYALEVRVIPGEEDFSGEVRIDIELLRATDIVWLNGTHLTLDAVELQSGTEKVPTTGRIASKDFLALELAHPVGPGTVTARLRYHAVQTRKEAAGLFQVREGALDYAFTHFEPLDARRAFPCFDEPSFKVPWDVSLTVKKDHLALGNMPVTGEAEQPGGMKRVTFQRTPPLPSYLIALAAGPFERVDAGSWGSKKTPVGIVVPKGKAEWARWAVESTGPILEQHEAYFGIPYPYEKLDQIAIPLSTGAMENPGLITYGHQLMLVRPGELTIGQQRAYAAVCAHELAHLWFGDLVTTAWWDDLWLNEAFATWASGQLLIRWKPQWQQDVAMVQSRHGAATNDSLASARRIRQPIESNDDISNAFDSITYNKGAAVISMFEQYVTAPVFQRGVHRYLTEHFFGNATASDFLDALSKEAAQDIRAPFSTFLEQPGVPLVDVALSCPKGGTPAVKLSQRRYLPAGSTAADNQSWKLPVCVRWGKKGASDGRACTLLTAATGEIALEGAKSCPDWVLPNEGMHGYYRSRLAEKGATTQLFQLGGKHLSMAEKVGMLGDLTALVRTGEVDISEVLALVPNLIAEDNRHTLTFAANLAAHLGGDFLPEPLRARQEELVRISFGPKAKALGFTVGAKDDDEVRLIRPLVLGMMGRDGKDPATRKEALRLASGWLENRKALHADLVDTALTIAVDEGGAAFYEKLLTAARAEKDRRDRVRMITALAGTRDPELSARGMSLVLTDDFDARESVSFLWGATGDFRTRALAFAFVKEHFEELVARLPKDSGAYLAYVGSAFCDAKMRAESEAFFTGRSTKYTGGPRILSQALESIDLCIAFRERQQPGGAAFMAKWKR
jgi:alanyl aminopeptidase